MNKLHPGKPFIESNSPLQNGDKIDELYRPYLIHTTTYMILTEQIMALMPSERNIILTMNEYDLTDINPFHPKTSESPTHIIIFCIRFLSDGLFQPIGALMIYKYENQSKILAECVKAYINDLWKIGLYVVATVSPPFETFKGILSHLVNIQNFNSFSGVISYSVAPFKEIIHIYDVQFLLIKLQNLFKESDIQFEEGFLNSTRQYQASWADISYVLTSSKEFKLLSEYFTLNKEIPRRVHIFSEQIYAQLMEAEAQGTLSPRAGGSLVLLNCIRTFLKFLEQDLVDVKTMTEIHYWDGLIDILQTMQFQKSKSRTCTKETPFNTTHHVDMSPTVRRKIDFEENEGHKEEKAQTGKSKNRKKRKKVNKQNTDNQKSGKDLREQALSKILSDDTTVTVHFFNGFEPARPQPENCDIDKNNNSSSEDCSKSKPSKNSKKKSKSKNVNTNCDKPQYDKAENESKKNISDMRGSLKYPRISLREFSRLSAEEENVLNNENIFNGSKQTILNNNENIKDLPSTGGCLKKSITDILNSLNNVQFYSNFSTKNTNVENENLTSAHKDVKQEHVTIQIEDCPSTCDNSNIQSAEGESDSPRGEYLLNNKQKTYGTVENSNLIDSNPIVHDLSRLSLNESSTIVNNRDLNNSTQHKSIISDHSTLDKSDSSTSDFQMDKSSLSDSFVNGTQLRNTNLSKNDLYPKKLSGLLLNGYSRIENKSDFVSGDTDSSIANKLNLNRSNISNADKYDIGQLNHIEELGLNKPNLSINNVNGRYSDQSDIGNSLLNLNKSYSNMAFNLNKPDITDFNLNKSNLNKPNLSSLILSGADLSKPPADLSRPNLTNFESKTPDFSTFVFNGSSSGSVDARAQNQSSSFCEVLDFSNDHFCSKSDEETENSIKASCDNVPNILELLSAVEKSPTSLDNSDFENNSVTYELLCTVYGIERLFNLLYKRRVRVAKPDAFIVEHIDFLVTIIKERNKNSPTAYYGNSYGLFNAELAFSTLQSNVGLYLVSKE